MITNIMMLARVVMMMTMTKNRIYHLTKSLSLPSLPPSLVLHHVFCFKNI